MSCMEKISAMLLLVVCTALSRVQAQEAADAVNGVEVSEGLGAVVRPPNCFVTPISILNFQYRRCTTPTVRPGDRAIFGVDINACAGNTTISFQVATTCASPLSNATRFAEESVVCFISRANECNSEPTEQAAAICGGRVASECRGIGGELNRRG